MSETKKPILLGAFEMMNPSNGMPTWTDPRGRGDDWDRLDYWVDLAAMLDRAGFDFLFFADTYGYATLEGRMPHEVAAHGIQFPALDPMLAIPALARATENIGFVVTSPTTVEMPYATARRFATLDRFTGGRIGWNIVTGSSQATTDDLFGVTRKLTHDQRYDAADDFLDTCLRFWEHSWDDDAELRDRARRLYADPAKLHRVEVDGEHQRAHGIFAVPPTPQRTPVLFQAGTSPAGRAFAARNSECVFVQATTPSRTAAAVADIRALAAERGRDPRGMKLMAGLTVFVGETEEEARRYEAEFDAMQTDEIVASLYAGNTGIDLLTLDPDKTLHQVLGQDGPVGQMGTSNIERFLGENAPTVREILDQLKGRGTRGFRLVGDPTQVADGIEALAAETDLDGFLIEPVFEPADLEDFGRLVMPILRERGRLRAGTAGNTLRARLTEQPGNDRLGDAHPVLAD